MRDKTTYISAFVLRGFGALASFLIGIAVARSTSPEEAGVFFIGFAIAQNIAAIGTLGASPALVRLASTDAQARINPILFKFVCLNVAIWLGVLMLSPVIQEFFTKTEVSTQIILVSAATGSFLATCRLVTSCLQGREYFTASTFFQNSLCPLIFVVSVFALISSSVEVDSAFLMTLYLSSAAITLWMAVKTWKKVSASELEFRLKIDPDFVKSIQPLFIIVMMETAVTWSGHWACSTLLSDRDLAIFATSQRAARLPALVLIAANLVSAPRLAKAYSNGDLLALNSIAKKSSQLAVACVIPFGVFLLALPEHVMSIFGDDYMSGGNTLMILSAGQLVAVICGSVSYILTMTGNTKDFRNATIFSGVISILVAVPLTRAFGTIGAAASTAIAISTQNLVALWLVKRRFGFNAANIFRRIHQANQPN